jgi:hypothetical protein
LQFDIEVHKFGVLFDQLLDLLFFEVFQLVLLEMEHNVGAASDLGVVSGIVLDGEGAAGLAGPQVLGIFVVLGVHFDFVSDKVAGVKTDTYANEKHYVRKQEFVMELA